MSDHADDAAWFRQMLEELGHTQASFARWLAENGDNRPPVTIARGVRRMANGEARVSGEMRVILSMMRAGKKKAEKRGEGEAA